MLSKIKYIAYFAITTGLLIGILYYSYKDLVLYVSSKQTVASVEDILPVPGSGNGRASNEPDYYVIYKFIDKDGKSIVSKDIVAPLDVPTTNKISVKYNPKEPAVSKISSNMYAKPEKLIYTIVFLSFVVMLYVGTGIRILVKKYIDSPNN